MSVEQDALRLFVVESKKRLSKLLQRLQWTEQGVLQQHRAQQRSGKDLKDTEELPPSCIAAPQHSLQLDAAQLQQLLGTTSATAASTINELQAQYSASQKLTIYEHVLKCTPRQSVSFEENASFAELVAVTTRAQKHQRRHRKSKPTLREEMHQLVELQMQAVEQQLKQGEKRLELQLQERAEAKSSGSTDQSSRWGDLSASREPRQRCRSREDKHSSRSREQRQSSRTREQSNSSRSRGERHRSRSREHHRHNRHHSRQERHTSKKKHKKRSRSRSRSQRTRHKRSHYN